MATHLVGGQFVGRLPGPLLVSVPATCGTTYRCTTMHRVFQVTTHEVSVRKRLKDGKGEWISVHSFHCLEQYALSFAVAKAEGFILDLRGESCPF